MSKDFFHYAKQFFYGTFASRILGMVRDITMAFYFGSSPEIASFMVAYRLSNLFRRLFGEGTMNAGFIPHFESLKQESSKKGYEFYRNLNFSLLLVLVAVVALVEMAFGFFNFLYGLESTLFYTMIMLPGLIFICLYALNSAFLNCHSRFFLPAIAPIFFNLIWIMAVIFVQFYGLNKQVILLSIAVVVAYFSQFLITHFSAHKIYHQNVEKKKWSFPKFFSKDVVLMLKPLTYSIIGVGALQVNSAVDVIFAKIADPSGPAYLWYAIRLQQLPFALFSIAISSALLPTLSRSIRTNQKDLFNKNFEKAMRSSFIIMLICTVGIFVLGGYAVNLIYGRGDFNNVSIGNTYRCLVGYSFGLVPQTFVLIMANCFYAKKDYKTPAFTTIASVLINMLLNAFFVFGLQMDAFSVSLATSISACFNALVLYKALKRNYLAKFCLSKIIKIIAIVALSGSITYILGRLLLNDPTFFILFGGLNYTYPSGFFHQLLQFFSMFFVYFGSVLGFFAITSFFKTRRVSLKLF